MSIDQQLFPLINREWTTTPLDLLMATLSSFDLWLPFLVVAALLTLSFGGFRARAFVVCALLVVAVADGVISNSLKHAVNRPRPNQSQTGVRIVTLRKAHPQVLALFKPVLIRASQAEAMPISGRSFPSSHIMNNFAVAMTLALFYRRFGWLAFVPAALVAYSRIYVGSHWPSDALISIFLGVGVALIVLPLIEFAWRRAATRWPSSLSAAHPTLWTEASNG